MILEELYFKEGVYGLSAQFSVQRAHFFVHVGNWNEE
jgi:hypothetical protein